MGGLGRKLSLQKNQMNYLLKWKQNKFQWFYLELLENHGVFTTERKCLRTGVVFDFDVNVGVGHCNLLG
jgi:hypothetical protein